MGLGGGVKGCINFEIKGGVFGGGWGGKDIVFFSREKFNFDTRGLIV